ncbi:MAG: Hsp70 family protein, partial [Betaproteobacteria bacterium]|nr:Hsp70 family protein [Betaproteobacteria bacterium]
MLQEPIAASIAYGIQAGAIDGHWLVFDFGGGTFDAALMRVEDGVMRVVDTEGDNHLGGKNLDQAIVEELLLPALAADSHLALTQTLADPDRRRLLAGALKRHAERAKIQLSTRESVLIEIEDLGDDDEGEEIIAEVNLLLSDWERVARPIFQRSIDLCRTLLSRNGLSGESLRTLIPVGGPTLSQTLRRMLREQLTERLDTRVDPMTAVARGAAIFASTKQVPRAMQRRDASKAQLTLRHPDSTVETEVTVGVRVDRELSTGVLPGSLSIELVRADRGWTSGRLALEDDVAVLTAALEPGVQNRFEVTLTDAQGNSLDAEPAEFSILQGLRIAHATLPYHIGVDVVDLASGQQGVFPIAGLEKNRSLPARGKGSYRTAKTIRAGESGDRIRIEFVEMAYEAIGSKASLNQPVGSITLTGEDLATTVPQGSTVEIALKVDASRRITASVFFPALDEQIDRAMEPNLQSEDQSRLRADLTEARSVVSRVRDIAPPETLLRLEVEFDALEKLMAAEVADLDRLLEVRERLR